MRKLLVLAIITFVNFTTYSQNSVEAKNILDEVAAKVEGYQNIEIEFHAFIRGEAKFDSLDALMAQMAKDCDEARDILA